MPAFTISTEPDAMNIFLVFQSSLIFTAAGFLSLFTGLECQAQDTELVTKMQSWIRKEGTDVLSPEYKKIIDAEFRLKDWLNVAHELQQQADRRDRIQHERAARIQQIKAVSQERPEGPPRGRHPDPREQEHDGDRPESLRGQHSETRSPEGAIEADQQRIQALVESADRVARAGLPDVAHELRQRAERLEREVAAKRELLERLRDNNRRAETPLLRHENKPSNPPIHELHEQLGQLRHDMHKLSEQMEHLTNLIEKRNKQGKRRHPREDMDDQDEDHKDRKDYGDDHEREGREDNDND
jgi:hypothetical protein